MFNYVTTKDIINQYSELENKVELLMANKFPLDMRTEIISFNPVERTLYVLYKYWHVQNPDWEYKDTMEFTWEELNG